MASQGYTLTDILLHSAKLRQVSRDDLAPGDRVFVKTSNSVYEIHSLGDGLYSVSGGWFERKGVSPSKIRIAGCTWGGSVIKIDTIAACGLRLEFSNRVITTPIQKIIRLPSGSQN